MSRLSVGNIAVEAQRAVRLNSKGYGDRVLCLIDDLVAENKLSPGGLKEILRAREFFAAHFYGGGCEYVDSVINQLMLFAFKERSA